MSDPRYGVIVDLPNETPMFEGAEDDELQFRDYHHNDVEEYMAVAYPAKALGADPLLSNRPSGSGTEANQATNQGSWFGISSYSGYFDVDTDEVLERITAAIYPVKGDFLTLIEQKPDLYGPFWIPTTVIFLLFVTSSLAGSIAAFISGEPWSYDVTLLSLALSTVYTYVGVIPLALWGASKYMGVPTTWTELISVYGYGMTVWIPLSLFCITPDDRLRWLFVVLGFLLSGYFILRSLYTILSRAPHTHTRALTLIALACHIILAIILKIHFFSYAVVWPSIPVGEPPASSPSPTAPAPAPSPTTTSVAPPVAAPTSTSALA